jgi:nitrogen fixation NifU-like protein
LRDSGREKDPAMEYSNQVIDHYENPRNVGSMDKNDDNVGTGLVGAPACGDVMRLQIRVDDDGLIADAKFKTFGCGSAIASSSLATEWLKGRTLDEATKIKNRDIAQELNLPPVKIHCSVLAEDAIKSAIEDFRSKQRAKRALLAGQEPSEAQAEVSNQAKASEASEKELSTASPNESSAERPKRSLPIVSP